MIKNLSGDYETVEYENQRFVMLYDNDEIEEYPTHWHNAVEVIIPLHNGFTVTVGGTDYHLNEKEIIIIPPGELHSMPAQEGRRIIFQCDNSIISDIPALEALIPVFSEAFYITPNVSRSSISSHERAYLTYIPNTIQNQLLQMLRYISALSIC